jgi:predicted ABC-type ATPase
MPHIKRLRVFAGPNGSGKTTVVQAIAESCRIGFSINADDLQRKLETSAGVVLSALHASLSGDDFKAYYEAHPLREHYGPVCPFSVLQDGRLALSETCDHSARLSYAMAVLADYLLTRLVGAGEDVAFEAVFTHPSELSLMRQARASGYRVYLYYVGVATPEINKQRVALRVTQGGRGVPDAEVVEQYERSLALLKDAVALSDRAYVFDNTYSGASLKLEVNQASDVIVHEPALPDWMTRSLPALVPK